jgi:hypothetical protein
MRTIAFRYWNFNRRYNSFEQFTRLQETKHTVHINKRPLQFTSYTHMAFRLFFNWSTDVKTSVPSTELKYRCMSNCADRLVGWTDRSISIGDKSSNEHDAGSFYECIMFCISIRRMSIFIMLNLGRRRVVSPIHIPLYVPQQRTPGSPRFHTTDVARSSQLQDSHINL